MIWWITYEGRLNYTTCILLKIIKYGLSYWLGSYNFIIKKKVNITTYLMWFGPNSHHSFISNISIFKFDTVKFWLKWNRYNLIQIKRKKRFCILRQKKKKCPTISPLAIQQSQFNLTGFLIVTSWPHKTWIKMNTLKVTTHDTPHAQMESWQFLFMMSPLDLVGGVGDIASLT